MIAAIPTTYKGKFTDHALRPGGRRFLMPWAGHMNMNPLTFLAGYPISFFTGNLGKYLWRSKPYSRFEQFDTAKIDFAMVGTEKEDLEILLLVPVSGKMVSVS